MWTMNEVPTLLLLIIKRLLIECADQSESHSRPDTTTGDERPR